MIGCKKTASKNRLPGPRELRVLRYLMSIFPDGDSCSGVGSHAWGHDERHGAISAVQGGGDYAAQMLLGRMRTQGWVNTLVSSGSSVWAIEPEGRRVLRMADEAPA